MPFACSPVKDLSQESGNRSRTCALESKGCVCVACFPVKADLSQGNMQHIHRSRACALKSKGYVCVACLKDDLSQGIMQHIHRSRACALRSTYNSPQGFHVCVAYFPVKDQQEGGNRSRTCSLRSTYNSAPGFYVCIVIYALPELAQGRLF